MKVTGEIDGIHAFRVFAEKCEDKTYFLTDRILKEYPELVKRSASINLRRVENLDTNLFEFSIKMNGSNIAAVTMRKYPAMCGAMQFHSFMYNDGFIKKEALFEFLDLVLNNYHYGLWYSNRRLIVAMVTADRVEFPKNPYSAHSQYEKYSCFITDIIKDWTLNGVPESVHKDMSLEYPWFYEYFQKQRKCKTMDIHFNVNSNRLVHLLEVII